MYQVQTRPPWCEPGYKLAALGRGGAFEAVFCGEAVGRIKPSPATLGAAMDALGVPADRLLPIGDRADTDGVAAAAIGCRTAILGREFASFFELRDRLCAELARS